MLTTGKKGIELIKHFESLHDGDLTEIGLQPKMDPIGIWTEGYGHAMRHPDTGEFLKGEENEALARELTFINDPNVDDKTEAEQLLQLDLISREKFINKLNLNLNQNQFDAVVSFTFNLGTGNLLASTLLKRITVDPLNPDIAYQFSRWNKAGGKILAGLVRRRKDEATLYFEAIN